MIQFLPLVLVFVLMYFLLIRPQQQKDRQHREMLSKLKSGDQVLLQSGLVGRIKALTDEGDMLLDIASGVEVRCMKSSIARFYDAKEPRQVRKAKTNAAPSGKPEKPSKSTFKKRA